MSNKQKKHTEQREIKEGYCPECGEKIYISHNSSRKCSFCLAYVSSHYNSIFLGYRIWDKTEGLGSLLPATNSQHRSGIGDEEIVSNENIALLRECLGLDDVKHKRYWTKKMLNEMDSALKELEQQRSGDSMNSVIRQRDRLLKENKHLNSHPPTPNAPSPEVIEKLVESCRATAIFNNFAEMHLVRFKAKAALALIDGEKK